jgi:hypothetical protein
LFVALASPSGGALRARDESLAKAYSSRGIAKAFYDHDFPVSIAP